MVTIGTLWEEEMFVDTVLYPQTIWAAPGGTYLQIPGMRYVSMMSMENLERPQVVLGEVVHYGRHSGSMQGTLEQWHLQLVHSNSSN